MVVARVLAPRRQTNGVLALRLTFVNTGVCQRVIVSHCIRPSCCERDIISRPCDDSWVQQQQQQQGAASCCSVCHLTW